MGFKVVDTFNGWECHHNHRTEQAAKKEKENMIKQESRIPGGQNRIFCYRVVPADAEWGWDESANKYRWSYDGACDDDEEEDYSDEVYPDDVDLTEVD